MTRFPSVSYITDCQIGARIRCSLSFAVSHGQAFSTDSPNIFLEDRQSIEIHFCSALLLDPAFSAVTGTENRAAPTNDPAIPVIGEGDIEKRLSCINGNPLPGCSTVR